MFVRFFRQNQPAVLLALVPLCLLLWPGASPVDAPLDRLPEGMPVYNLFRWLCAWWPGAVPTLSLVLVPGLAILLGHVVNEAELFQRRNHLAALCLPLILALFPRGLVADPALVGMPFVVLALNRLWGVQGRQRILAPLFDAGLLLGLAALCYLPYAFLLVVVWSSLAVMRPFYWREYVVPSLGMAVMLFIVWAILRLILPGSWDPSGSLMPAMTPAPAPRPHWMRGVVLMAVAAVFLAIGSFVFAGGYARGVMREKNTRASFLAFSFSCGLLVLFNLLLERRAPAVLVAVPVAVFISWPLLQARRVAWAEAGVVILFALGLWGRWG